MVEKILELNRERTIFWTLLGSLLLSAGFYMYFINATIHNVLAYQNLENEASRLSLDIGSKEFRYITMRNTITLPLAYSMGFRETSTKTFISKKSTSQISYLYR